MSAYVWLFIALAVLAAVVFVAVSEMKRQRLERYERELSGPPKAPVQLPRSKRDYNLEDLWPPIRRAFRGR